MSKKIDINQVKDDFINELERLKRTNSAEYKRLGDKLSQRDLTIKELLEIVKTIKED